MEKLKKVFGDLYGHVKEKKIKSTSDIANDLLETASKTPTNWRNVFDAIEEFRNELLSIDKQHTSATEYQMGLVVPLIAYFVLVLETDLIMPPEETRKFINLVSDNFTSEEQFNKLKSFLSILHNKKIDV